MTVTLTPLDKMKHYLREEHRMKDNTDYAIAFRFGSACIIAETSAAECIIEAANKFGIEIGALYLWDTGKEGSGLRI